MQIITLQVAVVHKIITLGVIVARQLLTLQNIAQTIQMLIKIFKKGWQVRGAKLVSAHQVQKMHEIEQVQKV